MIESTTCKTKCGRKGDNMKFSVKKTFGGIGAIVIYAVSCYAVYIDPIQIGSVLWPLCIFVAALFGIKKFGNKVFEDK